MIDGITIIGAGNGGKAAAADLALQNKHVRLFEFPEFKSNLEAIIEKKTLTVTGAVSGQATLERVSFDLSEALEGVDTIMICTQALAHDRVAHEIAPFMRPEHLLILNPGSTGGSLHFAHVFRKLGLQQLPTFVETSTLTYGCRAKDALVEISVKVNRVAYGTLPAKAVSRFGLELEALYTGLVRTGSVLEAGLNNANPVIHPPITILNAARIENEGDKTFFYKDGVSPTVARLIQKLDEERMALLRALGYPAQPDPVTSVQQGYASSTDYLRCYKNGPGYISFRNPNTLDNRYFHEDVGMGLVMFCSLGKFLKIPTPTCQAVVSMGEALSGINYFAEGKRTMESLGLYGLRVEELKTYLETGEMPTN
ncbi:MAG: NAD/NADP octopine/nopaline dehydrogenase family protein [Desulfobacterales bacterium]|nr:MAG: NAD/NADP octopine/nopaline dehydrogenase family protein [Desulfobacterales bacterium]